MRLVWLVFLSLLFVGILAVTAGPWLPTWRLWDRRLCAYSKSPVTVERSLR